MKLTTNTTPASTASQQHKPKPPPTSPPKSLPTPFRPFPVDVLPEPIAKYVREGASAIGCEPAFVALPLLSALASAIGNTYRLSLKRSWTEPAIVWTCVIGESGSAKSPAIELALKHVRRREHDAMTEHAEAMELHELAVQDHKSPPRTGKGRETTAVPVPPICRRSIVDDVTTEKVAQLLQENPRGLLLARDELSGWLGGFDRYTNGKGGDAAKWLEVFGGRALIIDRKSTGTQYVPRAAVSACGGIQPAAMRRALGVAHVEDGLAARLLFAMPPRTPKRWTDDDVDNATDQAVGSIFGRLYQLEPERDGDENAPRLARLTPEAKSAFIRFVNSHGQEHAQRSGAIASAWSKLEAYCARLALIVHLVRWAGGENVDPDAVEESDIEAAAMLVRWFGYEAERVYAALLGEEEYDPAREDLIHRVQKNGGSITPRELRSLGRFQKRSDLAESALDELVRAGMGRWEYEPTGPKGGAPSRAFVLNDGPADTTTPSGDSASTGSGSGTT